MTRKKNPRKGAEEFFYEHAGYVYDPKTQTAEEGRRATAKALANAEQWAWDNNYEFEWEREIRLATRTVELAVEAWSEFLDGTGIDPEDVSDIVSVVMRTEDGEGVESLGAIIEGYDNEYNRNYRRVVEAELALEQQKEPWEFPKRNPVANPQMELLDTEEDIRWLREVHIPNLPKNVKSAVIFGNEDYPDKISTFVERSPSISSVATVYRPDEDGVYHVASESTGVSRKNNPGSAVDLVRQLKF
jgi:hypothetical protein